MGIIKEFKEFAVKGNVLDMAIGIIIGAEFGKIVNSVVNDLLMPPLGLILGNTNFTNLFIALNGESYQTLSAAKDAGAPIFAYGNFIQVVVNFVIVAFAIFMMLKAINKWRNNNPEA